MRRFWRIEMVAWWHEPHKQDKEEWFLFDYLMQIAIAVEIRAAVSIYQYLRSHGQI